MELRREGERPREPMSSGEGEEVRARGDARPPNDALLWQRGRRSSVRAAPLQSPILASHGAQTAR